ncbi:hypothetical protein C8F01DRAFT_1256709 [Mycena amicta]|nr:hypothetical protein C8F01DRAFT_1256709 [Mycena amicta]
MSKSKRTFLCYNDITVRRAVDDSTPKSDDIFKHAQANGGRVPPRYAELGSDAVWNEALKDLRENFVKMEFRDAYARLMDYDGYSVAGYLRHIQKLPTDVINSLQTRQSRTGQMDQALSETVLASLVFNDPRFQAVAPSAMVEKISVKPVFFQRATIIEESDDGNSITVTFDAWRPQDRQ